jgi:catechol-2,3-dioxygenase
MELPRTAEQRGRIAPAKFSHVLYVTADLEALVSWYRIVLEAQPVFCDENICFLTYDAEHHRIAIARAPGLVARPVAAAGVHHVAYSYRDLHSLLATYERLKALGIRPFWAINHGPTTSLYYRDPDGNQTELQVDNYDSAEETAAYFLTREFAQNPIGVEFDPDGLVQRLREGVAPRELARRPAGPPSPIR